MASALGRGATKAFLPVKRTTSLATTSLLVKRPCLVLSRGTKFEGKAVTSFSRAFKRASGLQRGPLGLSYRLKMSTQARSGNGTSTERSVLVPIGNGSEEMEAVILIDVLRRAGATVTVASVEGELQVTASRGVKLVADVSIKECKDKEFDLIVLPGGMPGAERLRDSSILRDLTQKQAAENRPYAAICAAPAVALHSWGLVEGKKATAHPAFSDKLPDTSAVADRVVKNGSLLTSRGPGTAIEFALSLISELYSPEKAESVAKPMVIPLGKGKDRLLYITNEKPWVMKEKAKPKVLVPVANGSEEMETVIIADVLVRGGADVVIASVEGAKEIVASRGVKIVADSLITDAMDTTFDLIVLPGGMPGAERLGSSAPLAQLLQQQAQGGRPYAAICAAPAVALLPQGLLDDKVVTAHPAFSDKLPDQSAVDARVVIDGLVMTSRGPGTAQEFALMLVEKLLGEETARSVAGPMVMNPEVVLEKA